MDKGNKNNKITAFSLFMVLTILIFMQVGRVLSGSSEYTEEELKFDANVNASEIVDGRYLSIISKNPDKNIVIIYNDITVEMNKNVKDIVKLDDIGVCLLGVYYNLEPQNTIYVVDIDSVERGKIIIKNAYGVLICDDDRSATYSINGGDVVYDVVNDKLFADE